MLHGRRGKKPPAGVIGNAVDVRATATQEHSQEMPDSSKTATIELDICGARAIKAKTKGQHAKVEPVVEFFARAGLADIEIRRVEADPRDQGDIPIRHPRA